MSTLLTPKYFNIHKKLAVFVFLGIFAMFIFSNFASSAQNNYLKIIKSGSGSGTITIKSPGMADIVCKSNKISNSYCSSGYPHGVSVTVTAISDSDSTFTGWSGACSGGNSVCVISNLNADKEVKASFIIGSSGGASSASSAGSVSSTGGSTSSTGSGTGGPYTLTIERGGSGGGGMVGINGASTCYLKGEFTSCSYTYSNGTNVALTAVPDSGMSLSWSGACGGSSPNCNITMNNHKTAIADFIPSSDPPPKINFFYADPNLIKSGGTTIIHGQASNISKCILASFDDKTLGAYGYPTIFNSASKYYWRDVTSDFKWSAILADMGVYNYTLFCRGLGSYDNPFFSSGIVRSDIVVDVLDAVTLNVTKSGTGAGTVKSNTFTPSFAWANNGLVSGGPRNTGYCSAGYSYVKTHSCNSLTAGTKVYDGSDRGTSYGDWADAFPVYDGLKTATAREYTNSCSLGQKNGGTVNEWQCKDKVFDIDCGIMCSASYMLGDNKKITLIATPNFGSIFSKWTGVTCEEGKNNGNACTVTMNKIVNIKAEFSSSGASTVASWHFEETSGTVKDSTTYANNLTPTGTTVINGVSGNARNLNNKNEYLTLSSPINFPLGSSARTVDFWAKPSSSLTGTGYVFGYGVGGANQAFGVSVSGGYWWFQGFGGADMNSMVAVVPGKWTYVAVTYDGTTLKMYIDGVLANSTGRSLNTPSSAFYVGRAPWDSANNFVGVIDEFRVSVGALSASEISDRYNLYAN